MIFMGLISKGSIFPSWLMYNYHLTSLAAELEQTRCALQVPAQR